MNRRHFRWRATKRHTPEQRVAMIAAGMQALAEAADTVTGATLVLADGEVIHLDATDARWLYEPPTGRGDA